jgi:hypothetical protein
MSAKDCLMRPERGVSSNEAPAGEVDLEGEGLRGGGLEMGLGAGLDFELDLENRLLDLVVLLDVVPAIV